MHNFMCTILSTVWNMGEIQKTNLLASYRSFVLLRAAIFLLRHRDIPSGGETRDGVIRDTATDAAGIDNYVSGFLSVS